MLKQVLDGYAFFALFVYHRAAKLTRLFKTLDNGWHIDQSWFVFSVIHIERCADIIFYIQSHLLFDNRSENEISIFRDCYFGGAGSGYWRWGYIFLVLKFWSVIQFNSYSSTVNRCDEEPIALRSICKAALPRWYYNKENNECQQFQYGGCGANANIFFTPEDCEKACKKWWTVNGFFGRVNFYQFSIAFMG